MLSNVIPRLLGSYKAAFHTYIPKDLPNSHDNIRSHIEKGSEWLLRELKLAQDNLVLDLKLSRFP